MEEVKSLVSELLVESFRLFSRLGSSLCLRFAFSLLFWSSSFTLSFIFGLEPFPEFVAAFSRSSRRPGCFCRSTAFGRDALCSKDQRPSHIESRSFADPPLLVLSSFPLFLDHCIGTNGYKPPSFSWRARSCRLSADGPCAPRFPPFATVFLVSPTFPLVISPRRLFGPLLTVPGVLFRMFFSNGAAFSFLSLA